MANIERKFFNRGDGDEDEIECTRARENGDYSMTDDEGENAGNNKDEFTRTAGFHDGPQTGVKGVLADFRHSQRQQKQQHEQQKAAERAAYQALASKDIIDNSDRTIWTKDKENNMQEKTLHSDIDSELDELDSDEENERLFAEYRDKRMADLRRVAEKRGLGVLRDVTPEEYVEIVEQNADSSNNVFVLLVDQSSVSHRFASFVEAESGNFCQTVFLCVPADECGFCDAEVVPIVLVYRYGQLKHNLVRVVDQFADPRSFEQQDVAHLLRNILLK